MSYRHTRNELSVLVDKVDWVVKTLETVVEELKPQFAPLFAKAKETVQTATDLRRMLHAKCMGLHPLPADTRMPSRVFVPTPHQRHSNVILAAVHSAGYTEEQTIQELFQAYESLVSEHRRLAELQFPTPIIAKLPNPSKD
jgi:hypothetical protein